MGYIQGTVITVTFTVLNQATGQPYDPADAQLAVKHPDGSVSTITYNGGTGALTRVSAGVYRGTIDTIPAAGVYSYEGAALGPNAVRQQNVFVVEPKIGP